MIQSNAIRCKASESSEETMQRLIEATHCYPPDYKYPSRLPDPLEDERKADDLEMLNIYKGETRNDD